MTPSAILLVTLIPALSLVFGASLRPLLPPARRLGIGLGHGLAGGLTGAVVATVLPETGASPHPVVVPLGFGLGALLVFLPRHFLETAPENGTVPLETNGGAALARALDLGLLAALLGGGLTLSPRAPWALVGAVTLVTLALGVNGLGQRLWRVVLAAVLVPGIATALALAITALPPPLQPGLLALLGAAGLTLALERALYVAAARPHEVPATAALFALGFLVAWSVHGLAG